MFCLTVIYISCLFYSYISYHILVCITIAIFTVILKFNFVILQRIKQPNWILKNNLFKTLLLTNFEILFLLNNCFQNIFSNNKIYFPYEMAKKSFTSFLTFWTDKIFNKKYANKEVIVARWILCFNMFYFFLKLVNSLQFLFSYKSFCD